MDSRVASCSCGWHEEADALPELHELLRKHYATCKGVPAASGEAKRAKRAKRCRLPNGGWGCVRHDGAPLVRQHGHDRLSCPDCELEDWQAIRGEAS